MTAAQAGALTAATTLQRHGIVHIDSGQPAARARSEGEGASLADRLDYKLNEARRSCTVIALAAVGWGLPR